MLTDGWRIFEAAYTPVAGTSIWHLSHAEVQRLIEIYMLCRSEHE